MEQNRKSPTAGEETQSALIPFLKGSKKQKSNTPQWTPLKNDRAVVVKGQIFVLLDKVSNSLKWSAMYDSLRDLSSKRAVSCESAVTHSGSVRGVVSLGSVGPAAL